MHTHNIILSLAVGAAFVVRAQDDPCNYCKLYPEGLSQECVSQDAAIKDIIARDSSCGRNWDPFCLVEYNDCYNQACGADAQGLVDSIAATGGPEGAPINRTQILLNCPPTPFPTPGPTRPPTPPPTPSPT